MRSLILGLCIWLAPFVAATSQASNLPNGAEQRGEAAFRFLGFQIYTARLFTKGGLPLDWSQDFGLELTYKRNLSQSDLVEATLREMDRMGNALPIRGQLETVIRLSAQGTHIWPSATARTSSPSGAMMWRFARCLMRVSKPGSWRSFWVKTAARSALHRRCWGSDAVSKD